MNALRLPKAENGASQGCCSIAITLKAQTCFHIMQFGRSCESRNSRIAFTPSATGITYLRGNSVWCVGADMVMESLRSKSYFAAQNVKSPGFRQLSAAQI